MKSVQSTLHSSHGTERQYPFLIRSRASGIVVMMLEGRKGVVVYHEGRGGPPLGTLSDFTFPSDPYGVWEPFNGILSLSN